MADLPYTNRELDARFIEHEKLDELRFAELRRELLDGKVGILPRIERQTMATNGKVAEISAWRYGMMGGLAVVMAIIIPAALVILKTYL